VELQQAIHHIALGVEYDGHCFHGWQRQVGQRSVQQTLEEALARIADRPIKLIAAGRTDAGVHATQQIVAFATTAERPERAWIRGANSLLPEELSVRWALPVPTHFHPRYSATGRRYQYVFLEAAQAPAIARHYVTWSAVPLDDAAMHMAAQCLIGEHDFTTFRSASCQAKSPFRCVFAIAVRRFADFVVLDVTANAFLQHMVRNIAGALLQVGRGEKAAGWVGDVLTARNRDLVGATAPPTGLYLVDVQYGPEFEIPRAQPPLILRAAGDVW
jgi:tRNA pseudouridine38-40 synthase